MNGGLIGLVVVLILATAVGLLLRRRSGRFRAIAARVGAAAPAGESVQESAGRLTATDLRTALGQRATLVQFSTAFCAPCRPTRQILAQVAEMVDGVVHVDIDATSRPDLVRRLRINSAPTVFVLGPDGVVAKRATGQPRKADVIAALAQVVDGRVIEHRIAPVRVGPGSDSRPESE